MAENVEDQDEYDESGSEAARAQGALTLDVLRRIGASIEDLWVHCLSMGGAVDKVEISGYLHGLMRLPALERDMLSQSVNEMIDDITRGPRAPFSTYASTDPGAGSDVHGGADECRSSVDSSLLTEADLIQVVYSSVTTQPVDGRDLAELLRVSRYLNALSDLTGLLLHGDGCFLQVLEGPAQAVHHRMRSITADPRHTGVRILIDERREYRQFPSWTMRCQPMGDSLSAQFPGFERTFVNAGRDDDPVSTVRAAKELVQWFEQWS